MWKNVEKLKSGLREKGDKKRMKFLDAAYDVAVIGAGLVGILLADRLQAAGKTVAVVEAGEIGGGQSGRTTAKVTAQNGLCYQKLIQKQG